MAIFSVVASFTSLAFASAGDNDSADLARVEALAKQTRVSEARILDEIMGRMGRIEATTSDIRALIEAMPDANTAPVATPVATPVPSAAPVPKPAVCPPVPAASHLDAEDIDDTTRFPVSLVAGGSALLALLVGLGIGRRRTAATLGGTKPLSNVPSRSGPDSVPSAAPAVTNGHPPGGEPVWRPGKDSRSGPDSVPSVAHGLTNNQPPGSEPVWRPSKESQSNGSANASAVAVTAAPASSTDSPAASANTKTHKTVQPGESARSSPVAIPEVGGDDVFDPTLELAEIMMSMGLGSGAAQALEEHIRANPKDALTHWLKLLEVYRKDGHRADFENAARELRKNFNIQASDWLALGGRGPSLEDFSRVIEKINALWNQPAECVSFMTNLLEDNRDGSRNGFPQSVAEEILTLIAVQRTKHPELIPAKSGQSSANPSLELT